ncbi:hepatitis A virus cellular receptor 1 [Sapajus apella]|uniref:Hepatitis A virus cellular receptor 1 n=1 Tax=Sapajus apella TaxID=9515 RepID=A0A6J3GDE1_SAPAP|nr:hepatitis A virus cellular receptor 1 [Sapajus apella]
MVVFAYYTNPRLSAHFPSGQPHNASSGGRLKPHATSSRYCNFLSVGAVAGRSVALPCSYSCGAVTSTCWKRGGCTWLCTNSIVWTNGTHVNYWKNSRYQLLGDLSKRNVSLTLQNTVVSDSGLYCCHVENRGWFNDMRITISLEIIPPSVMTTPIVTTVSTVRMSTTVPTATSVPTTMTVSAFAPPMPLPTQNHEPGKTDVFGSPEAF